MITTHTEIFLLINTYYCGFPVIHATLTDFDIITVKDFMVFNILLKCSTNSCKKYFSMFVFALLQGCIR